MAGEIKPRTIRVNRPMPEEVNGGRTDIGPMIERIAAARSYEEKEDVFAVSINAGFASADVAEIGPTVLVSGQGDFTAHAAFAETIADDIWKRRFEVLNDYLSVDETAAIAVAYERDKGRWLLPIMQIILAPAAMAIQRRCCAHCSMRA